MSGKPCAGVSPLMRPFQNEPVPPAGLESGINFEGATSVLGGARRGFWRSGAGVMMLCAEWKGVSRYDDERVGLAGEC
jgi:hypothetical protein